MVLLMLIRRLTEDTAVAAALVAALVIGATTTLLRRARRVEIALSTSTQTPDRTRQAKPDCKRSGLHGTYYTVVPHAHAIERSTCDAAGMSERSVARVPPGCRRRPGERPRGEVRRPARSCTAGSTRVRPPLTHL